MRSIFNITVEEAYVSRIESLLNRFRIGLNDWDKTKTFDCYGERYVNYTLVCDPDTYEVILTYLYKD